MEILSLSIAIVGFHICLGALQHSFVFHVEDSRFVAVFKCATTNFRSLPEDQAPATSNTAHFQVIHSSSSSISASGTSQVLSRQRSFSTSSQHFLARQKTALLATREYRIFSLRLLPLYSLCCRVLTCAANARAKTELANILAHDRVP